MHRRILPRGLSAMPLVMALAVTPVNAQQYYGNGWYGMIGSCMMGGGMMGGGASNRPVHPGWGGRVLDHGQVAAYLREGDGNGVADPKTNTVTVTGKGAVIDLVAVQPDHIGQTFEVHGLVNPTLVVSLGATVHLNLVNMDCGNNVEHGIIVTPAPPPYPYMSMMATGPGVAWVMPLLPWRSNETVQ